MDLFDVLKMGFGVASLLAGSVFELVKPKPSAEERKRQEEEENQRQEEDKERSPKNTNKERSWYINLSPAYSRCLTLGRYS